MTASIARIHNMAREIVRREGGYVDDPKDAGGATNYGVSLRYAKRLGLDIDRDGDTDADDIRQVTPEQAMDLYVRDFFEAPGFDTLPEPLWPQLFDMAVNAGPARALILLQEVLSEAAAAAPETGLSPLMPDGRMGPKTRATAARAFDVMGPFLINAYVDQRIAFYRGLAAANPSQKRFLAGWTNRANEFRVTT